MLDYYWGRTIIHVLCIGTFTCIHDILHRRVLEAVLTVNWHRRQRRGWKCKYLYYWNISVNVSTIITHTCWMSYRFFFKTMNWLLCFKKEFNNINMARTIFILEKKIRKILSFAPTNIVQFKCIAAMQKSTSRSIVAPIELCMHLLRSYLYAYTTHFTQKT